MYLRFQTFTVLLIKQRVIPQDGKAQLFMFYALLLSLSFGTQIQDATSSRMPQATEPGDEP